LGNINQAIVRKRDAFSAMLVAEAAAGPICMDLRPVPEQLWEIHPLSLLKRFKAECGKRPIRISPAVHFFMGGVRTEDDGQTSLVGLFACGEMVWGLHGANRMGGNALMECLVSGNLAGLGAMRWARTLADLPAEPASPATGDGSAGTDPADLRDLRRRLQDVAWECAGVVRSGDGMVAGLREAEAVWRTVRAAQIDTPTKRILRADLISAAFTLRAVLTAGLGRLESRGSFLRQDYPARDDARWLRNSRASWDPDSDRFRVEYVPVDAG
jgi:succinate dehydrogenase/fumarate reductase flavoprotein subunit